MMFAAVINDGLLVAAFSLFGMFALGFGGWVAREMYRTSALLSRLEERAQDHERRIAQMEARGARPFPEGAR